MVDRALPAPAAYLAADPAQCDARRGRLDELGPGATIGISWRGGTRKTRADERSLPLAILAATPARADVHLVSLQYGP